MCRMRSALTGDGCGNAPFYSLLFHGVGAPKGNAIRICFVSCAVLCLGALHGHGIAMAMASLLRVCLMLDCAWTQLSGVT